MYHNLVAATVHHPDVDNDSQILLKIRKIQDCYVDVYLFYTQSKPTIENPKAKTYWDEPVAKPEAHRQIKV